MESAPLTCKEIIKSTDAWDISERESAKNGIQRIFFKKGNPTGNGSNLKFDGQQVGTQHPGREPWSGSLPGITIEHEGIRQRQIKMPNSNDNLPGILRKRKGIGIIKYIQSASPQFFVIFQAISEKKWVIFKTKGWKALNNKGFKFRELIKYRRGFNYAK